MARDWVNLPSNAKPPRVLARLIAGAAKARGLAVEVLAERRLQQMEMGRSWPWRRAAATGPPWSSSSTRVPTAGRRSSWWARASPSTPAASTSRPRLPTRHEGRHGRGRRSGSVLVAAAELNLKRRLIAVIPLVENMVSGSSTRPGTSSGPSPARRSKSATRTRGPADPDRRPWHTPNGASNPRS